MIEVKGFKKAESRLSQVKSQTDSSRVTGTRVNKTADSLNPHPLGTMSSLESRLEGDLNVSRTLEMLQFDQL